MAMGKMSQAAIACLFVLLVVQVNGKPYSKFGRTCKDIGCLSTQRCIIANLPCTPALGKNCGNYPTCQDIPLAEQNCSNKRCAVTERCEMKAGRPQCVTTLANPNGLYGAGVTTVNGRPQNKPKSG